jgi:hypothetical protein
MKTIVSQSQKTLIPRLERQAALRAAAFLVAFSLALAGCADGLLAGLLPAEENGGGGGDGSGKGNGNKNDPMSLVARGEELVPRINEKFGIMRGGVEGVRETFTALHTFIQWGGLNDPDQDVIHLGDYIDLEGGLKVEDYNGDGGFVENGFNRPGSLPNALSPDMGVLRDVPPSGANMHHDRNPRLLVVVGINSFRSGKGYAGKYAITPNDKTSHVVFQFQDSPAQRAMNPKNEDGQHTNAGGYEASEMRRYLTPVEGDPDSGKFYDGLIAAGIPEEAFWGPVRYVSGGISGKPQRITDKVWLPTEWELFGTASLQEGGENESNQAWLEWYDRDSRRVKYVDSRNLTGYWLASAETDETKFRHLSMGVGFWGAGEVVVDGVWGKSANERLGVAPAFCIY